MPCVSCDPNGPKKAERPYPPIFADYLPPQQSCTGLRTSTESFLKQVPVFKKTGKFKSLSAQYKGWLKRRTVVEPAIGRLMSVPRMDRCWFQGALVIAALPELCCAVATIGRRDIIRGVWAHVDCECEQLDRKHGRQKIDFWSRRAGCFLKIEFCRAD